MGRSHRAQERDSARADGGATAHRPPAADRRSRPADQRQLARRPPPACGRSAAVDVRARPAPPPSKTIALPGRATSDMSCPTESRPGPGPGPSGRPVSSRRVGWQAFLSGSGYADAAVARFRCEPGIEVALWAHGLEQAGEEVEIHPQTRLRCCSARRWNGQLMSATRRPRRTGARSRGGRGHREPLRGVQTHSCSARWRRLLPHQLCARPRAALALRQSSMATPVRVDSATADASREPARS